MNRRLILIVIALWLIAYAAHAQAPLSFGNHDAGAARNTLSNVTPATGRAALGLGTMAVATSTDYVATGALALRLDTTNASISENLDVAGHSTLTTASATAMTITNIDTTSVTNKGITGVSLATHAGAGIANGASGTFPISLAGNISAEVYYGLTYGSNATFGAYHAIISKSGSSGLVVTELANADKLTLQIVDNKLNVQNDSGQTIYGTLLIRALASVLDLTE